MRKKQAGLDYDYESHDPDPDPECGSGDDVYFVEYGVATIGGPTDDVYVGVEEDVEEVEEEIRSHVRGYIMRTTNVSVGTMDRAGLKLDIEKVGDAR